MTPNVRSESTYRLAYVGLWGLGAVVYAALIILGHPPAATVAYFVGGIAAFAVHRSYEGPLFDERDAQLLRTASANTMWLVGWGAGIVFPLTATMDALGVYDWPAWLSPIALFVTAMYAVWLAMLLLAKYG